MKTIDGEEEAEEEEEDGEAKWKGQKQEKP